MTEPLPLPPETAAQIARPLRLALAGLWLERLARAFWPLLALAGFSAGFVMFGGLEALPAALWPMLALLALAALWGLWRLKRPNRAEALARLDATLPGRPLSALTDRQALGETDPASRALWQAHLARMAERARKARAPRPDPALAPRDPYALRLLGAFALGMGLLFGAPERLWGVRPVLPGTSAPAGLTATWEGWITPPAHTRRPTLYMAKLPPGRLDLPEGSEITLRLYGEPGALSVLQTLDGPLAEAPGAKIVFVARKSGKLEIKGAGGAAWEVTVLDDRAPKVALKGGIERTGEGKLRQAFTAEDDFAVASGTATFTLDTSALDRRYGLATDPEPRPPLVLDLPMPPKGDRSKLAATLVDDASKHPFANLPVTLTLSVKDGAGQTGSSEAVRIILPGRRFFDPLAAALIEQRRDLMWSADNAPRVAQILRTVAHRPDGFFRDKASYLALGVAQKRLEAGLPGPLDSKLRDEIAEALWQIAVQVEDGGLADALAAMQRAQERLSEAIRNGASPEEIDRLMAELNAATQDYIRKLAEQAPQEDGPKFGDQGESQQITGDQIQQMMDEIQKLMKEGRMAEAQALLEKFNQMMQNLQITQGNGQGGMNLPGGKAQKELGDTLRQQQGLSDESFRELQDQMNPGGSNRERQERGQKGEGSLADRQRALGDRLEQQRRSLPGGGGAEGEAARKQLDEAGRAMGEAEQALREGDAGRALDRQAEAIDRLREGMKSLSRAQSGARAQPGQSQQGGDPGSVLPRDPLGRNIGDGGQISTDQSLPEGADPYARSRELLDELRRRAGEQSRPDAERDYLKRLLTE